MNLPDQELSRIGRFRIDALIGKGGMGHVYKGFDEMLERPVALKALAPERQLSPIGLTRFMREARILSQLDDPNICRIYDYTQWRDHDFLVLEYIEGVTLTDAKNAGLSLERKLEVAATIARVLDVAHRADIIHRDLKPDNVMIDLEGKIKVLDFGLGRIAGEYDSLHEDERERFETSIDDQDSKSGSKRTTVGSIVGTLRYMSPEATEGEEVSFASDIYSFGVLLYELFSGRSPYPPDLPQPALMLRVMSNDIKPLDDVEDKVPKQIAALILDCLALDPEARPNAQRIVQRIADYNRRGETRAATRRRLFGALTLVAVLAVAIFATWRLTSDPPVLVGSDSNRFVLLPIINLTQEENSNWYALGLRDLMELRIKDIQALSLVPVDHTMHVLQRESAPADRLYDPDMVERLRRRLDADLITMPWAEDSGTGVRLRYALFSSRGRVAEAAVEADDITQAAALLGEDLHLKLTGRDWSGSVDSPNAFVNQIYAVGVHRLQTLGAPKAIDMFRACLQLDPSFQWARLKLAACAIKTGDWDDASQLLDNLVASVPDTDPQLHAQVLREYGYLEYRRGNWDRAQAFYQRTLSLLDETDDLSGLADVRRLLGVLAHRRGANDLAWREWQTALDLYNRARNQLGAAYIYNNLGVEASNRGHWQESMSYHEKALAIRLSLGDLSGAAGSYLNLGSNAWDRSDLQQAESYYSKAADIYSEIGNKPRRAQASANLAECLKQRGHYQQAIARTKDAINLYSEIGVNDQLGITLNNLADTYRQIGFLNQAESVAAEALRIHESIDDTLGSIWCIHNLALIAHDRGDNQQAIQLGEYALKRLQPFEKADKRAAILTDLGEFYSSANRTDKAEPLFQEAIELFRGLGSELNVSVVSYNLAMLHLKRGDIEQARQYAARAAQVQPGRMVVYLLRARIADRDNHHDVAADLIACARNHADTQWDAELEDEYHRMLASAASP